MKQMPGALSVFRRVARTLHGAETPLPLAFFGGEAVSAEVGERLATRVVGGCSVY